MKTVDLIFLIHDRTKLRRRDVERVLREMASLVSDELQANEIATLPYFGRLVPLEHTSQGSKWRRAVTFQPGRSLQKRLAKPFRRVRLVE